MTLAALIAAGRVTDAGRLTTGTGHCPSQNGESAQVFVHGQVCSVTAQFDIVNNLLELPVASNKLGPVLYRILAQLPGVEVIGTRTDALGRSGTAIEDPPGVREGGAVRLYLAYLRDPDGNKLCALYRMPAA